jgi:AraC-like DNA-binding protein
VKFRHISVSSSKGFSAYRCEPVSLGMGTENDSRTYNYDNRFRRTFSLFQYTLEGEGLFRQGSAPERMVGSGQAFLVNSPSDTGYRLADGKAWSFIYILFVGDMGRWHVNRIISKFGHILDIPRMSPPVELLLRLFEESAVRNIPDKFTLSARLYRFLMELYRQLAPSREPDGIRRAIRLIEQNYADSRLTLSALAREAAMSKFYFLRQFRRATGLTPHAYLKKVRLDQATDYLLSTEQSIKEISALTGFQNASYFCQAFRRIAGKTPGDVRNIRN